MTDRYCRPYAEDVPDVWREAVSGEAIGFTSSGHFQLDSKPARHTMSSPKFATLKWPSSSTAECGHGCQGSPLSCDITKKRPRQDSNLRHRLRRPVLYPLSYGGGYSGVPGRTDADSRSGTVVAVSASPGGANGAR